jgi:cysteine-rich repeat protein
VCGDGYVDYGEECDDGNLVDEDGCSATCEVEYFERDYACGSGCLATTIVTASVPIRRTDTITYSFDKTDGDAGTCDVSHFVLFDIPVCTNIVNVTSSPPGCATEIDIPCSAAGGADCGSVGPCSGQWAPLIGRPVKVDVTGNACSVTFTFANNLTFTEAPFGIRGGQACSNCTVLVPEGCYKPPQVTPRFACWWDFGNTTCAAVFNYSLAEPVSLAIVPKGPRNFLAPAPLAGTDNTPVVFTRGRQNVGHTAFWNCYAAHELRWTVDGSAATALKGGLETLCADCNRNAVPDPLDIERGTAADCNGNSIPDECDIAQGTSADANEDGVPDECDMPGEVPADAPTGLAPWQPGVIIGIVVLAICLTVSCATLCFPWGGDDDDDCDDDDDECERSRAPLLWVGERQSRPLSLTMYRDTDTGGDRGHIKAT